MVGKTSRRTFLKRTSAIAAAPACAWVQGDRPDRRPNILFALADDWVWPHASIMNEPVVRTPTFDRVVRSGVTFTNAFVSAPSCTPSRAAMLTGQWHWRLGEGANLGGTLPAKFPVYPDLLESAGYHVGFTRKGWSPGDFQPGGRTRNPAGPSYPDFQQFLGARRKGVPFCFWFGSMDPHRPYERNSGTRSGMRLEEIHVPPYFPDNEIVRQDICDYFWKLQRFDRETGELLSMLEKAGELDNTIVVMSGDNGWPFPRCKATLYDSGTHAPLAISWPAKIARGRQVTDFVSLADLAPTFLEAVGVDPPAQMTGRSLMPLLLSRNSGQVDLARDHVLTGMERHLPCRGEIRGGYPMRAIRTRDFHLIRNFRPERWPAGDPNPPNDLDERVNLTVGFEELAKRTEVAYPDIDAGPTKAYMVTHREDAEVKPRFEQAMGKRPAWELYDLRKDPYELRNVSAEPAYAEDLKRLGARLMQELKATGDPRATGGGDEFDRYIWYQGRGRKR